MSDLKDCIKETVQDIVDSGYDHNFTERDLNRLGVKVPEIELTATAIKEIREKTKTSQAAFARMLNVSLSSVRHWEQEKRSPSGSAKVLLELLNKNPNLLDYRFKQNR